MKILIVLSLSLLAGLFGAMGGMSINHLKEYWDKYPFKSTGFWRDIFGSIVNVSILYVLYGYTHYLWLAMALVFISQRSYFNFFLTPIRGEKVDEDSANYILIAVFSGLCTWLMCPIKWIAIIKFVIVIFFVPFVSVKTKTATKNEFFRYATLAILK